MKWMTSPETDKKWVDIPGTPGVPMRISTVTDPELVEKYPYFKIIYDAETQGLADGVDYRSRLPEWTQIDVYKRQAIALVAPRFHSCPPPG